MHRTSQLLPPWLPGRVNLPIACHSQVFFPGGAPQAHQGQPPPCVVLGFKRFLFDEDKRRMVQ